MEGSSVSRRVIKIVQEGTRQDLESLLRAHHKEVETTLINPDLFLLHEACSRGDEDLVTFLTGFASNINAANEQGTPLLIACRQGISQIVDVLLLAQAHVDLPDAHTPPSQCAFCIAAQEGYVDVLEALTTHQPEVWTTEESYSRVLEAACQAGQHVVLEYCHNMLISNKSLSTALLDRLLKLACQSGVVDAVEHLVTYGACVTPPLLAEHHGVIKAMLGRRAQQGTDDDQEDAWTLSWDGLNLYALHPTWWAPYKQVHQVNLQLKNNYLTVIVPDLMWGIPSLFCLSLAQNRLTRLPSPSSDTGILCHNLSMLYLDDNNLEHVPNDLFHLPSLRYLNLSNNKLTSLAPSMIDSMPRDRDRRRRGAISLGSASFDLNSAWRCFSLVSLDVSHNRLATLPSQLHSCGKLEYLNAAHNDIKVFISPWQCPLDHLILSHNNLSVIPAGLVTWQTSLRRLYVDHNDIRVVDQSVCSLKSLDLLDLSYNWLDELPDPSYWSCSVLETLNLSHNYLCYRDNRKEPAGTTVQKFIRRLFAQGPSTGDNSAITQLVRDKESVKDIELPGELFSNRLRELDLSHNRLSAVPSSVLAMKALRILNIGHNMDITYLPPQLSALPALYHLGRAGCHPSNLPRHLRTSKDALTKQVLAYLKQQMSDSIPYNEVKLMVVGRQSKGKTTLVRALREVKNQRNVSTNGIEVHDWTLSGRKMCGKVIRDTARDTGSSWPDVHFKVWDFAGQQDFYVTHKVFLSPLGLYVLVYDLRLHIEGVKQLRPWLLDIEAHALRSHVILVGTFLDYLDTEGLKKIPKLHSYIDQEYSRKAGYPTIDEKVEVSGVDGTNIDKLLSAIYKVATSIKVQVKAGAASVDQYMVGRMVPKSYVALQRELENEVAARKNSKEWMILHHAQYMDIVTSQAADIKTPEEVKLVTNFLVESGSMIHVSAHRDLYCISPQWLAHLLAQIITIDAANRMVKDGILMVSEAERMPTWTGEAFTKLIEVLEVFEIALQIDAKRLLIPSKLPREKPGFLTVVGSEPEPENLCTIYRLYKLRYTPSGLWSRLITQLLYMLHQKRRGVHRHSMSPERTATSQIYSVLTDPNVQVKTRYWQEGILVELDGTDVCVETAAPYYNGGREQTGILITLKSSHKHLPVLGFITDMIDSLVAQWYPGLEEPGLERSLMKRVIPCPMCMRKHRGNLNKSVHLFCLIECIDLILQNKTSPILLSCPKCGGKNIDLEEQVPDILLNELPQHLHLTQEQMAFDPEKDFLGRGGEGSVYRGHMNGVDVAIKENLAKHMQRQAKSSRGMSGDGDEAGRSSQSSICSEGFSSLSGLVKARIVSSCRSLRQEVMLLSQFCHPCLVTLLGVNVPMLSYVLELCPNESLHKLVSKARKDNTSRGCVLERNLTHRILYQIALGVSYLHSVGIVYKDLKGDNVLVWSTDLKSDVNIKLSDYGLSCHNSPQGLRGFEGTYGYQAPEMRNGIYDEKIDIFAFGIVIAEVLSGEMPFMNMPSIEVPRAIMLGQRPEVKDHKADPDMPKLVDLMRASWAMDPTNRPSAAKLVSAMRQPDFTRLFRIREMNPDSMLDVTCVYSSLTKSSMSYLRYWTGDGRFRRYYAVNLSSGVYKVKQESLRGPQVCCMLLLTPYLVVGNMNNQLEVLCQERGTGDLQAAIPHITCTSSPLCMQALTQVDDSRYMFIVGFISGDVITYALHTDPISPLYLQTILQVSISNTAPVTTMTLTCDEKQVWAGCGAELIVINTDQLTRPDGPPKPACVRITVPGTSNSRAISEMLCHGDQLWVRVHGSSMVSEYDVGTRELVCHLDCGRPYLHTGDLLTSTDDTPAVTEPRVAAVRDVTTLRRKLSQVRKLSFGKKKQQASLKSDLCETIIGSMCYVEGALWLGLKSGLIVVVNVSSNNAHGLQHGVVMACMDTATLAMPCLSSPISHFCTPPGHFVAAIHKTKSTATPCASYTLATWQSCDLEAWMHEQQAFVNLDRKCKDHRV